MPRLPIPFLVSLILTCSIAADPSCSSKSPTIYVDIHNRTVTGATARFQYGSFIGVGLPYQNQSLWPSLSRNETSFATRGFCGESKLAGCVDGTGGSVDLNASITWREDPKFRSSDSASIATTSVGGTDQINLWQHFFDPGAAQGFHVENTPVEYALSGDVDPGVVGLGSASTLMQSLVDQKLISAKTFSLYIGNGMERAGPGHINGSNIFGGYDSSRMTGEVHTYNMDFSQPDCLPVTIADIVIDDPDHDIRNRSIIDNGKSFQARITTDQYPMLLPQQVTQNFKNLLGAGKSGNADNSLNIMQPFSGIMRIKLSDGFEVTLPTETVFNTSGISPVQDNTDANYTGPFYLSTAWLSQVYLTLDYDTSKFHIAQVVQQADNIIPMPLCVNATPVPYERHPKPSQFAQAGLAGAIVGGFIGGIAIGVALLVIVLSRKRNRLSHEQQGRFHRFSKSGSDDTEMESLTPVGGGANTPWARAGLPNTSYKDVDPRDEDMEIWGNGTASFVILHE